MAVAAYALPTPAIDLDIQTNETYPDGDLITMFNAGYALGQFDSRGAPPQVGTVAGKKSVTMNGFNGYRASFIMPSEFSGSGPYTIKMTVFNPGVQGTERVFGWTRLGTADRAAAIFCYGTNNGYGVCNHWGTQNDMGFDRGVPTQHVWHNIIITYSGVSGWEKVYVDGVLNALEKKPDEELNNIEFGGPVWIGCTDDPSGDQNFSGSLAVLKVWPAEATWTEIMGLSEKTPIAPRVHPPVVNGSFEAGLDWAPVLPGTTNVNMGDNRIIPGWACADLFIAGSPGRAGIGCVGKNLTVTAGGGDWDNGKNKDGNRVLALRGTATAGQAVSQWFELNGTSTYRIIVVYNAKTGGTAQMKVYFDGSQIGSTQSVTAVEFAGGFNAGFYQFEANVVPPADGHYELKIEQANPGTQNVLLVDKVELINWDPPVPIQVTPWPIDFNQLGAGGKTLEREIKIRNLSSRTLDLWQYSRIGTDSGSIVLTDSEVPGTNGSNVANIRIGPYDEYYLHVKFTSASAIKTYNGQLRLRWRNGPYANNLDIPWTALVPDKPRIYNGGFEAPITNRTAHHPLSYYNQLGDNVDIPYWCKAQNGVGVGERVNHPYINRGNGNHYGNGIRTDLPEGKQALWIANVVGYYPRVHGVSQTIAGWDKTKTYRLSLWAMARNTSNWNPAKIVVKLGGNSLTPSTLRSNWSSAISTANLQTTTTIIQTDAPWMNTQYMITPPNADNGMYDLEILGVDNGGEKAVGIDRVELFEDGTLGSISMPQLPNGVVMNGTKDVNSRTVNVNIINQGASAITLSGGVITGENKDDFSISGTHPTSVAGYGNRAAYAIAMKARDIGRVGGASLVFSTTDATTPTVTVPLWGNAYDLPAFRNGSFEEPVAYWANDGFWRCHLHSLQGGIPGWSQTGAGNENYGIAIPIDPTWQDLYWNNGAQGKGSQALWIETGTSNGSGNLDVPHFLRQRVYGFRDNINYTVSLWVNATKGGDDIVQFEFLYGRDTSNYESAIVELQDLTAVAALGDFTVPFVKMEKTFMADYGSADPFNCWTDGSIEFSINVPNQVDLSSLLVDAIEISSEEHTINAVKSWTTFE